MPGSGKKRDHRYSRLLGLSFLPVVLIMVNFTESWTPTLKIACRLCSIVTNTNVLLTFSKNTEIDPSSRLLGLHLISSDFQNAVDKWDTQPSHWSSVFQKFPFPAFLKIWNKLSPYSILHPSREIPLWSSLMHHVTWFTQYTGTTKAIVCVCTHNRGNPLHCATSVIGNITYYNFHNYGSSCTFCDYHRLSLYPKSITPIMFTINSLIPDMESKIDIHI